MKISDQADQIRSEIRYFDDELNPVSRDKATWAVFREVDDSETSSSKRRDSSTSPAGGASIQNAIINKKS